MQIGQLAQHAGVAIDTVRYYERQGLLPQPQRRASGYRQYGQQDISRLRFIRRAKDLGFSLLDRGDDAFLYAYRAVENARRFHAGKVSATETKPVWPMGPPVTTSICIMA